MCVTDLVIVCLGGWDRVAFQGAYNFIYWYIMMAEK